MLLRRTFLWPLAGGSLLAIAASAQAQATPDDGATEATAVGATSADSAASATADQGLGEILVTARRREENLQDVPISITAFDGGTMERLGIQTTADLGSQVPSLSIGSESIFTVYPNYGIRGQRNDSFLLQQAPTVITYFAGAPQGHPAGFGETMFDLGSVQVLNGPQGTLFGKNSTGGAVVVEPARPNHDLSGNAYVSYGSFDSFVAGGMLNLPLTETLAVRLAAEHRETDGFMMNRATGQHLGAGNGNAVRGSVLWEPTPSLTILTIADFYRKTGSPGGARLAFVNTAPSSQAGGSQLGNRPALLDQVLAEYALQQSQTGNDRFNIAAGAGTGGPADIYGRDSSVYIKNWGVTNDITLRLTDNLRLRNIASYRRINTEYDTDYASGNYFLTSSVSRQHLRQYTEELQLLGEAFNNRLNYVIGGFYFDEKGFDDIIAANILSRRYNMFDGRNRSYSAFAQGTLAITDHLKLTLGARYNYDRSEAANRSRVLSGTSPLEPYSAQTYSACGVGSSNAAGALVALPLNACIISGDINYEKVTWTASLEYSIPDGAIGALDRGLFYATARRGYRAGGYNARATTTQTYIPYAPETVDDLEAGIKADWDFGGVRVRTNLAVFYDQYKNLQRQISVPVPGVPNPQGLISNAASARVYGAEFEFRIIPFRGFEIGGFYNYINAKYLDYFTTNRDGSVIDLSNDPFTRTPNHKYTINARYAFDLADNNGEIAMSGSWSWKGNEIFEDTPLPNGVTPQQPSFGLLSARLEWNNFIGSGFDLAFYGRNLTNRYYMTGLADISTSLGVAVFLPGEPRSFGGQIRYRF